MGKEHLGLGLAAELSLGPRYVCPVCGEKLVTERSGRTNWEEWCFTQDGRRHYKNRCNLKKKTKKVTEKPKVKPEPKKKKRTKAKSQQKTLFGGL